RLEPARERDLRDARAGADAIEGADEAPPAIRGARREAGARRIDRGLERLAAQARTEPAALRIVGGREEEHVLAVRPPRAAARATEDPGRADRGEEGALVARVALDERAVHLGLGRQGLHAHEDSRSAGAPPPRSRPRIR